MEYSFGEQARVRVLWTARLCAVAHGSSLMRRSSGSVFLLRAAAHRRASHARPTLIALLFDPPSFDMDQDIVATRRVV